MRRKIVIVGGGLGGLAARVALRRAGHEVAIFEQAKELREIGAGLSLWPNATRALQELGLLEAARAIGSELLKIEVLTPEGEHLASDPTPGRFSTPSLCILRPDLLALLAAQVPSECVHTGERFESFEEKDRQVLVRFVSGREESGDVLVGADGLFSSVRSQLFGPSRPVFRGCHSWRGVADFDLSSTNTAREYWGRGRRFGLEPLKPGRTFWYATENAREGDIGERASWKERLRRIFGAWTSPVGEVIDATCEEAIFCHDLYDRVPVPQWGKGRVTLLGDAAHPTTPFLGQGACMALEDGLVLAQCLQENRDVAAALRHYKCQRVMRTAWVTWESRRIGWIGQLERPVAVRFRTAALRWTPQWIVEMQQRPLFTWSPKAA